MDDPGINHAWNSYLMGMVHLPSKYPIHTITQSQSTVDPSTPLL